MTSATSPGPSSPAPAGTPRSGWLVPVQLAAVAAHLLPGGPGVAAPTTLRRAGAIGVVAGLALAGAAALALGRDLTPAVTPRPGATLRTTGVFAVSRHPLYAGLLAASAGAVLVRGRLSTVLAATALAGVLHLKADVEERVLAVRFGPEWSAYASRTPRLVPLPGLPGRPRRSSGPCHQSGSTTPSARA